MRTPATCFSALFAVFIFAPLLSSAAAKSRRALLQKRRAPFDKIGAVETGRRQGLALLQARRARRVGGRANSRLGRAQGQRRVGGDRRGQFRDRGVELLSRNDAGEKAARRRLSRR